MFLFNVLFHLDRETSLENHKGKKYLELVFVKVLDFAVGVFGLFTKQQRLFKQEHVAIFAFPPEQFRIEHHKRLLVKSTTNANCDYTSNFA